MRSVGYEYNFKVSGACYPEMHPDSNNRVEDILNLKRKVESGCQQLITQLFFEMIRFIVFKNLVRYLALMYQY